MKQIAYIILVAFCLTSCNNWLDVRPDTEQKDNDQFSTTSGFFDALVGCYMSLASSSLYGEKLTISNIESLANLWYVSSSSSRYEDADLAKHDYTTDNCKNVVNSVYGGLYRAIVQANMIIKYADEQSEAFTNDTLRYLVQGEAYAIRALCQFDALRLFGQLPQNATQQVMLPYSYTTSIKEMPAYYDFDEYVTLLKDDLDKAEKLLAISDPILDYTFEELEGKVLVMSPFTLKESYWAPENQLWLAGGGFGCSPTAAGRAVYATCLGDGEHTRWNREDFIGILDEQHLPAWAQSKLDELRPAQQEQTAGPVMGGMTME